MMSNRVFANLHNGVVKIQTIGSDRSIKEAACASVACPGDNSSSDSDPSLITAPTQ